VIITYYEPLHADGRTLRGRRRPVPDWTLPTRSSDGRWVPGPWVTARTLGPLSIRANGVLVLAAADLPRWAHFGTVLARVETDGDEPVTDGKDHIGADITRRVVRRDAP